LLAQNSAWRGKEVRLLRVLPSEAGREESRLHLEGLIATARIKARAEIAVAQDAWSAIRTMSADAAVVFLGFMPPPEEQLPEFVFKMNGLMHGLGAVVLVWSAGEVGLEH
jgi:hypothetical protein